jgi:hypothetical protein
VKSLASIRYGESIRYGDLFEKIPRLLKRKSSIDNPHDVDCMQRTPKQMASRKEFRALVKLGTHDLPVDIHF